MRDPDLLVQLQDKSHTVGNGLARRRARWRNVTVVRPGQLASMQERARIEAIAVWEGLREPDLPQVQVAGVTSTEQQTH